MSNFPPPKISNYVFFSPDCKQLLIHHYIMSDYNFKFSDKLPWLSDAAIAIFSEAKLPRSGKMKKVIAAYRKGLVVLWQKCFSQEHVLSRSNIEHKLTTLVKDFYIQVYNEKLPKPKDKNLRKRYQ